MTTDDQQLDPRTRMVRSAARLIRERGVHGVGMRQIAADADGPRGSLQRYFPGGKNQVLTEAVDYSVANFDAGVSAAMAAPDLAAAIEALVGAWREALRRTDYTSGCPMAALVVDASANDVLREHAALRLGGWCDRVAEVYGRFGYDPAAARDEALLVVTAIEGAVLMGRAARTTEALDLTERMLTERATR
ncbi:MAG: TetR/AcrR family transcriptional regulator [Solirubrobacteraceae bacterium]|nr:TetR/AcrR family transcriptional regulator [Patulibacter sp.]